MRAGMRDMMPFLLSGAPLAVIGGAYGASSGLGWAKTMLLAMCVNSGTVQFVGTRLLNEGATTTTLCLTTLVLCLRLVFYSTILRPHARKLPLRWQVLLGFGLIDAIFFVTRKRIEEGRVAGWQWHYLGGTGLMYLVWMGATLAGIAVGATLSHYVSTGMDFPMTALFAAMLGTTLADWRVGIAVVAAGGLSVALAGLPYGVGVIIAALAGAAAGFAARQLQPVVQPAVVESAR